MNDSQKKYEARMEEFNAKLDELDAKSKQWDAEKRADYESDRDNFIEVLDAWKDNAGAKWDEFSAESSQLWHGMKAKWYSKD